MQFIPYGNHWIGEEDIEAVGRALRGERITQGSLVEQFEQVIADFCQAKYGVALSSATAGLTLAYRAVGIGRGDEVITTPLTFAATSNALVNLGAKPVFCDIREDTLNIDEQKIEEKITTKTKAVAIVDFAGHPCEIDKIKDVCQKHNLFLIEDACHSLGSEYKGRKIGGLVDLTVFSFHPVKLITTGEGGMVLTNNQQFAERMKRLRHHGIKRMPEQAPWHCDVLEPGYNFRITDFQCALGISQFKKIDKFISRIREIKAEYDRAFSGLKAIKMPFEADYVKSAWHIYPVQIDFEKLGKTREQIFAEFKEQDIGLQVHYIPLHLHKFFQEKFGYQQGDFPIAEKYYQQAITLPLFPAMDNSEIERVIKATRQIL